jgi:hypothetical protein
MKRRQKPIILITVMLICAGLIVVMNPPQSKPGEAGPPPPVEAPKTGAKDVPVASKSQASSSVAADIAKSKMGSEPMHPMKGPGAHMPQTPSALNDRVPDFKPQPSSSMTASGWYTTEAPKSYEPAPAPTNKPKTP